MLSFNWYFPKYCVVWNRQKTLALIDALPQTFKDETDEMLRALIAHWSVIKTTSIDGLRQSFLQRSGKLQRKKNEWLLQVEQMPYDMLLQQLPWGISMLKLPWMTAMLVTEWN